MSCFSHENILTGHRNFYFIIFILYCQMPPKYTNKFDKKIPQNTIELVFETEIQDCRDGRGLQLIFGQDVHKSKLSFW